MLSMLCTVQNVVEIQRRNRKKFLHETALYALKAIFNYNIKKIVS
jgi:hypothetical protein